MMLSRDAAAKNALQRRKSAMVTLVKHFKKSHPTCIEAFESAFGAALDNALEELKAAADAKTLAADWYGGSGSQDYKQHFDAKSLTFTMYHGTSKDAASAILSSGFQPSSHGMFGPGVYLTRDKSKAQAFVKGGIELTKLTQLVQTRLGRSDPLMNKHSSDPLLLEADASEIRKMLQLIVNASSSKSSDMSKAIEDVLEQAGLDDMADGWELPLGQDGQRKIHKQAKDGDAAPSDDEDPFAVCRSDYEIRKDAAGDIDDGQADFDFADDATFESNQGIQSVPHQGQGTQRNDSLELQFKWNLDPSLSSGEKRPAAKVTGGQERKVKKRSTTQDAKSLLANVAKRNNVHGMQASPTGGQGGQPLAAGESVEFVGNDTSLEDEEMESIVSKMDFKLSRSDIAQKLNTQAVDLEKLIRESKSIERHGGDHLARIADQKKLGKRDRWTYEMLAESQAISKYSNRVLKQCRDEIVRHAQTGASMHTFEWVCLVDNSGSMSVRADQTAEALVVLLEVLRKMECPFAVATFGSERNQTVLKQFNQPCTYKVGEAVLSGLTFDDGSKLVTGLEVNAKTLFRQREKLDDARKATTHRIMLIITDGFSDELKAHEGAGKSFPEVCTNVKDTYDLEVAVLQMPSVQPASQPASMAEAELKELQEQMAVRIQAGYRGCLGRRRAAARRVQLEREEREWAAAIKINNMIRGWLARQRIKAMKEKAARERELMEAALNIQRVFRGHIARVRVENIRRLLASLLIQRVYRGHCGRERARRERERQELLRRQNEAATQIQASWRMKMGRDEYRRRRIFELASTEVQRVWRGYLGRRRAQRMRAWQAAEPGAERLALGLQMIEESKLAFERQQEEIDALHRAQEQSETRVSQIHAGLVDSERELAILERELQEIDQIERDLHELTHEQEMMALENADGIAVPALGDGTAGDAGGAVVGGDPASKEELKRRQAESYALEMAIHLKRAEREKKKKELEAEFASVFAEVEAKKAALSQLEIQIADMEATRLRKDREFT
eukprot:g1912.t1